MTGTRVFLKKSPPSKKKNAHLLKAMLVTFLYFNGFQKILCVGVRTERDEGEKGERKMRGKQHKANVILQRLQAWISYLKQLCRAPKAIHQDFKWRPQDLQDIISVNVAKRNKR